MINNNRKIGIGLTAFGAAFLFLGVLLLFDRGLLALGNMLFLSGITLLIGARKTVRFFLRPGKLRGTVCFLGGIAMVLWGWAFVGMLVEVFGIFNLFGNFFPIVFAFLRNMPIIGPILNLPGISRVVDKLSGGGGLPMYNERTD
eukprot:TRINITY_DN63217_c0_g1_i3.p2 TRINITY_DN63217_c0_g1~~TRINITY_DN63217_c0_g1_i3.p2  ORF type:complete len:144 (+),score=57.08 TRINITY_DN63217_c0_g1_i3:10-441(+)